MNAQAYIDKLVRLPSYRGQVAHVEHIHPRQADYAAPEQPLHPALQERLEALGVKSLYSHQAQALDEYRTGPADQREDGAAAPKGAAALSFSRERSPQSVGPGSSPAAPPPSSGGGAAIRTAMARRLTC